MDRGEVLGIGNGFQQKDLREISSEIRGKLFNMP